MPRVLRMTVYLTLAVTGLIGGFVYLSQFFLQVHAEAGGSILDDVVAACLDNPLARGIAMDAVLSGAAFLVWLLHESDSLAMRRRWIYVALLFATPLAFAWPAFLFMRERRLAQLGWD